MESSSRTRPGAGYGVLKSASNFHLSTITQSLVLAMAAQCFQDLFSHVFQSFYDGRSGLMRRRVSVVHHNGSVSCWRWLLKVFQVVLYSSFINGRSEPVGLVHRRVVSGFHCARS